METVQRSLPINPKDKANPVSVLFFFWTFDLFRKGYRKVLEVGDLFQPLIVDKSQSLGDRLEQKWKNQLKGPGRPSLLKAMAATFWREFFYLGLMAVFNELCIRLTMPILLGRLLSYFRVDTPKDQDTTEALYYGAGIILLTTISSLTFNHFTMGAFHNGMKLRVAVCSVIYRKALRLSRTALGDTAPGKIVNLLSNDVSRFDIVCVFLHSMWTAPLLAIIVGILLWREVQWAGIVGIVVVFIVVPIQSYTGKLSSKFRLQTAIRTDERVRFMDEIISGVQSPENSNDRDDPAALFYGIALIGVTFIKVVSFSQFTQLHRTTGMRIRVAICSLIYRKTLVLSNTALGNTAPGKIVNLLSNDVSRFDIVIQLVHFMWSGPLLTFIMAIFLWFEVRWAGIFGIFVVFTVVPIQSYTGKLSSKYRYQTALRTDERIRLMDEVISCIQDNTEALYYGAGIILLTSISSLMFNHFMMRAFHNGMKLRVAACSVIYRKALRLSRSALGNTSPGKIVNLLSNDVSRFDIVCFVMNSMWTAPLLAIIVGVLLWREVQWAGIVGIVVVFIVVPIQSYTGKLSSKFRLQTAIRTDERVRFMDEIISGVQVIKMYAWEIPFSKLINLARRLEIKVVKKNSYVRALYMTFNMFTTRAAMFCTMMTMALTSDEITAARIFVIYSYFNAISWTMSQMFVRGVAEIAEALVAFKRLQKFLEYEEKDVDPQQNIKEKFMNDFGKTEIKKSTENFDTHIPHDVLVSLKDVTVRWDMFMDNTPDGKADKVDKLGNLDVKANGFDEMYIPPTLNRITADFKKGDLIGVVGPVGAGKSSLLQVILEELPVLTGNLAIRGKLSYACQEPWVFAASVRQNILFGEEMDRSRYDAVVKSCALIKDFEQFPEGDRTIIGDKGASLSGGQKARISLARAIYREADVYLLDDPLSAVDAHVGRHLFDEVIGPRGRLARRRTTRILVTHQVHFLKEADWLIVLNDGKIDAQGPPMELSRRGIDFAKMLETEENRETEGGQRKRSRSRTTSKGSVASLQSLVSESDHENEEEESESPEGPQDLEKSSKGAVKGSLLGNYLKAGGNYFLVAFIVSLFLLTQFAVSVADYWVSFWTAQEELRAYYNEKNASVNVISAEEIVFPDGINITDPMNETLDNIPTVLSTNLCMSIHGAIIIGIFTIGILRSIGFYNRAMNASQKLHDGMFNGIISAPMRFFDTNPSGRILNRFSKDTGAVDEMLPKALLDATQIILNMVGSIIVASVVKPIFLVPVVILGFLFMIVRKIYLKTSKNIKRLEGMTRSPVFTHLAATLSGLSTVRAFGAQKELIKEFDAHQDLHTGAWYMFISTSTAFGLSLDVICLIFMTCVTFYFLLLDKNATGDQVGLAITQAMALTGLLQWGIRQSAEVANQLMSVERMLEYCGLEPEKQPEKSVALTKSWISNGKLEFRNVFYRYYDGADPVLKGISFEVKPQEKVGIVGRTGAGKSSLIGAIFRLAKVEGDIIIDDVNTANLRLSELRTKLSIIPQDPVLFSGTIRRNLDPFEEYPDSELWRALEAVELKDIASGPLGLQTAVMAGGSNFSVGQRQLVCLARAILRNNKILVLDEATANVDPHTDSLIQSTIRRRFSTCTVLTIAHRLHTIMDSDRIIIMNLGKVEEFDAPYVLLQNPSGLFTDMVKATGPLESERLRELAKTKYESVQKIS